jgi:ABC-type uncharacterized transport system permease subunit
MWYWLLVPLIGVAAFVGAVVALGLLAALPWSIVGVLVVVGLIVLWVATLADVFRRSDLSVLAVAIWTVAIIIFPFIGTLVYIVARPPAERLRYRGDVSVE